MTNDINNTTVQEAMTALYTRYTSLNMQRDADNGEPPSSEEQLICDLLIAFEESHGVSAKAYYNL